ncbi:glycosyltransferase [Sporolactobacillus putidus]|uniref:Lipopolysaccharide 1,6-galactosyltransferase n=1 Tax=Sporolactobacillus putidus TaxID=492735 RepID=A0A917W1G5_9BACL|nr:glycosyltransferase [Sporolactobacillus putidus]GGL50654.1 lipopolysaccharide 1,6-galactosyltransferase [Sporolactobacillus putidus]
MKKVIFVIWHVSGKGGTETVLRTVTQLLQQKCDQYQPQIYVLGGTEDKTWLDNIKSDSSPFIKNKFVRAVPYFFWLSSYIKREKPDIVVGLSPMICQMLHFIKKMNIGNFPIISWMHFSLNANHMKKEWLLKANHHFAISTGIKDQLEKLGISDSKIHTIYNPVQRINETVPRPSEETVFLYIGRITFEGQKRLKDLLSALAMIKGRWRLEVIGDGEDISLCKHYAEQLSINQQIIWHGWQQDPWLIVSEATALVLTSSYEGFGMVLAEAISRGIYCVSSDCEVGPNDIIEPGINGILYDVGELNVLQRILQDIVNGKALPEQERMKKTLERFYLENYKDNFISALNTVVNSYRYQN